MDFDLHSDEELLRLFCSTLDESVFRALMERHYAKALGYIQKRVFCRHLAEELAQDAFLKVVRNRDAFDPSKKFAVWFYRILKNTAADALRQRQSHASKLEQLAIHMDIFPRQPCHESYPVEHLLNMVHKEDQTLLVDHFIYGMTFAELAEKHGRSAEALKKRVQRAIKKIRTGLDARAIGDADSFSLESLLK